MKCKYCVNDAEVHGRECSLCGQCRCVAQLAETVWDCIGADVQSVCGEDAGLKTADAIEFVLDASRLETEAENLGWLGRNKTKEERKQLRDAREGAVKSFRQFPYDKQKKFIREQLFAGCGKYCA